MDAGRWSLAWLLAAGGIAHAQTPSAPPPQADDAFTLGQIVVTGRRMPDLGVGADTLDAEAIYAFNRNSLDEAASLIPGVSASNTGGARNERLIFVRGFDRFQVPLLIDGIRVYLPADNRLDYGRFLTPDIATIQVAKGYASVLDEPGALGGLVNLVTRKPSDALELEGRGTLTLDRGLDYAGYNLFGLVGTRQDRYYAQGSYTRNVRDHFDVAGGFTPTPNEDGGEREFSDTRDWRMNVKAGFTPNATDEYSISYTRQEGRRNAPIETTFPLPAQRFWAWPYWNLDSLYFLSTTALGSAATLKTRAYRNGFANLLRSFDNRSQATQTLPRAFNSYYEDEAYGGSAQLDLQLTAANRLSLSSHYRRDRHVEYQQLFPSGATEPEQTSTEDTWSVAAENRLDLTPALALTAGASLDWRDLKRAEDFTGVPGTAAARAIDYPRRDASAWNAQGRLDWRPDAATALHASVSSRARFPTIFERFSSRFGGATSAPDLQEERATNFEVGGSRDFGAVRAESAVFYSDLEDVIFAVPGLFYTCTGSAAPPPTPTPGCAPQAVTQSRNVGSGRYYGAELSLAARPTRTLSLGGNYTYVRRDLDDPSNAAFRPVGVPTHKAFLYADWKPAERVQVIPSIEVVSDRNLVNTAGTRYFRDGSYLLANLRIDFEPIAGVSLGLGARNLFDDDYQLADGFPEEGRSFFASVRARY